MSKYIASLFKYGMSKLLMLINKSQSRRKLRKIILVPKKVMQTVKSGDPSIHKDQVSVNFILMFRHFPEIPAELANLQFA